VSDDMVNGTSLSDFYSMLQLLTKRSELLLSTNNELLNQLSKEINQKIVQMKTSQLNQDSMSHNLIQELDNQFILEEINELSFAHEFYQSIMENLEDIALAEKKLESQQERFVLVGDKLNLVKQYLGADESNERINVEIGKVRERIVHCGNGAKPYLEQINSTKAQIKKIKQQEQEYQLDKEVQEETMNRLKTLSKHLHLIDLQSLFYLDKQTNTNDLKLFKKTLDEIRFEHNKYEKQIYQLNAELTILRKDIAKYIKIQKEKDKIGEELNLYTSYLNLMHRNGLPYEILKGYLPYIEMEINQILESMVEFSIQFIFYDDEEQSQKDLKGKGLKANSGCIEIVIYYPDKKPYSVQLSSGFERFIIGLAVRIALCQISMIAKPNFIVIDEGWSCFDREHLENVGNVLNYLKTQYDHVLIISHLEQLKGQVSDYTIKIGKKNGFSYLMNGEKEKEKVSQKQSKKISTKKLREENVV
jgi:DNA repair exonuclease SbcCD ATPase subunit